VQKLHAEAKLAKIIAILRKKAKFAQKLRPARSQFSSGTVLCRIAVSTYVDAAYCYKWSSMVCRSVMIMSPATTAEPIEMLFGM